MLTLAIDVTNMLVIFDIYFPFNKEIIIAFH